ncbi:hypothetical protein F4777DRAFT_593541 [Nemania sp. FL0916]|nr:hypothetical protein F4777DRAFT_593541 [Nemania sp. FL0916]
MVSLRPLLLWCFVLVVVATQGSYSSIPNDATARDSTTNGTNAYNISLAGAAKLHDDDLAIADYGVSVQAFWWGFSITFTPDAVRVLNTLSTAIAAAVGTVASGPVAAGVAAAVATRAVLYEVVAGTGSLVLYSPWPIPLMLAPWAAADPRDDRISYTTFQQGTWAPTTKFYGAHITDARPSFATYGSDLYMFYKGGPGDDNIFYSTYQPNYGWGDQQQVPGAMSGSDVAVVEHGGLLHMLHRGSGQDVGIWHTMRAGNWAIDVSLSNMNTKSGPAVASFNGRLYMVAQGTDNMLWYASWNGSPWSAYVRMDNMYSSAGPSLAVYKGYLYCAARGTDGTLWWTRFDGQTWGPYTQIAGGYALTVGSPALSVYGDRLFCAARGNEGNLWFTQYDGSAWSAYYDTHVAIGGNGVALTQYQSELSDKDKGTQLLCAFGTF